MHKVFPSSSVVKNCLQYREAAGDAGLTPGSGRVTAGHGNPLQYSCLENPMDRGAWQATGQGVAKNRTPLKQPRTHTCTHVLHCSAVRQSYAFLGNTNDPLGTTHQ